MDEKVDKILRELNHSQLQLKASEERYHRMVVEVQDYAIILLDPAGLIQNWNKGAELIKGYTASEILGRSFKLFYPEEDRIRQLPEKLLHEAQVNGRVAHEGWRVRKDGSRFWGYVVITALHDANNELIGFSKVTRDLSERKQLEDSLKYSRDELKLNNEKLELVNEQLRSFTYVASHDLKEPLRKIRTFATLIRENNYEQTKSGSWLQKIIETVDSMQTLITDLLNLSEVGNEPSRFTQVDLNQIIETTQNNLEVSISEKKAQLVIGDLPVVSGNEIQLSQVFMNLISNSIKFAKNEAAPVITIKWDSDITENGSPTFHHITVSDNGVGFDSSEPEIVFEPFKRLHAKSKYPGTGIGLAIVKRVMENHKGRVGVETTPGHGTTFHLYFPVINNPR